MSDFRGVIGEECHNWLEKNYYFEEEEKNQGDRTNGKQKNDTKMKTKKYFFCNLLKIQGETGPT